MSKLVHPRHAATMQLASHKAAACKIHCVYTGTHSRLISDEWLYRVTMMDEGAIHPVESWDFREGDVWAFPPNVGHAILALEVNHSCQAISAACCTVLYKSTMEMHMLCFWLVAIS